MQKLHYPAAVVAAALAGSAMAFAAPVLASPYNAQSDASSTTARSWHRLVHRRWRGDRWVNTLRQLDLSGSQRASIRYLVHKNFQGVRPELVALRQKRAAFEAATPGSAEYQAASNDLGHAEANLALARMLHRSNLRTKIYQLLTPAQRTQLATIHAQRVERKQWRASHRPKA